MNTPVDVPTKKVGGSIELPSSISHLIEELEKLQPTKPSQVVSLLKNITITKEELMPYADFHHNPVDSYGRKLIYKGANYEIMVMSWSEGDMSAIHDHGYTMWGAVKIFGKAEHATFRWEDEHMSTLARWKVGEGDVMGVGHSLIHQMGNSKEEPFISLHVYGHINPLDNITGEARIFDLQNQEIQRVNGGAFLNLEPNEIVKTQVGPNSDFPTLLRFNLETYKRMKESDDDNQEDYYKTTYHKSKRDSLVDYLSNIVNNETQKTGNSIQWKILNRELKEAAEVQTTHQSDDGISDDFFKYAQVYDQVIGNACLDSFIEGYIDFFAKKYSFDFQSNYTLSIGCGTGLVEERILKKYECDHNRIYGMDLSESMINEARKRISADVGNLLELDPDVRKWNLAYSGLNVYQYLPHQKLEEAIKKTSDILEHGGYFLGDFITPDHIRWYPNVMFNTDKSAISLRTPKLVEEDGASFQESEIINIDFLNDQMEVHYAGKHKRFLPPIFRVRSYFEKYFKRGVDLFDAVNLTPIPETADSCVSTRYIVIARK